jgi:hypothetical protein
LIIWASVFGSKRGVPKYDNVTEEQREFWQQVYQKIYAIMKNDAMGHYESKSIFNTFKNRLSEIKKQINEVTDVKIIGEETYDSCKYIRFTLMPQNVFVDNVPIDDSAIFNNL